MTTANASPFLRERKLILGLLLILAAASWVVLIWQSVAMNSQSMGMDLTMGMSVVLFIAIWAVMMIAMMFPTAAPMILNTCPGLSVGPTMKCVTAKPSALVDGMAREKGGDLPMDLRFRPRTGNHCRGFSGG